MARPDNTPKIQRYSKTNYLDVMKIITPQVYFEEDVNLSGYDLGPLEKLLNSHLLAIDNIGLIFKDLSATDNLLNPNIKSASGIAPYFIKQNFLTDITPFKFEDKILSPLGSSLDSFNTSSEYINFISGTLLPKIRLNDPNLADNTVSAFGNEASSVHEYLVNNLSWFYFLNTSADGNLTFEPSTAVLSALGTKIYNGETLQTVDGIKAYTEYIWKNYETCSLFQSLGLIPESYVSSVDSSTTYTSGTQKLESLQVLNDILYSKNQFDAKDTKVKDAIESFLTLGYKVSDTEEIGPFTRFLKAIGFGVADLQNVTNNINLIYDIDRTPDNILPFVAELVGWRFFGHDPERWRLQLKNSTDIYKRIGTRSAIQFAVNSVIGEGNFDVSSRIQELWESYIPFLIYYSLATESYAFKDLKTWTQAVAQEMGVLEYSTSSLDENIRLAVDYILLALVEDFPDHFPIGKTYFNTSGENGFVFRYRNRNFPIPPFENYKYYKDATVSEHLIKRLVQLLKCFGVRADFADQTGNYIRQNTVRVDDTYTYGNEFLFFTSSLQSPPNLDRILDTLASTEYEGQRRKEDYIGLWNGKSSHISVIFAADTFDFNNARALEFSGVQALYQGSRALKKFLPAHAIADVGIVASATDDYISYETHCPQVLFTKYDIPAVFGSGNSGRSLGNATGRRGTSGIDLSPLNKIFSRKDVSAVLLCADPGIIMNFYNDANQDKRGDPLDFHSDVKYQVNSNFSGTNAIFAPRSAFRRRNYKHALPAQAYYSHTGFNMPVSWDPSVLEYSLVTRDGFVGVDETSGLGFIPLGFIPSSCSWADPSDAIWDICEGLDSQNSFYGYPVSATYPCMGNRNMGSNIKYQDQSWSGSSCDHYVDMEKIAPIIAVMWSLNEKIEYNTASAFIASVSSNGGQYSASSGFQDVVQSYVNANSTSPSSHELWENFSFGRGIHRLYRDYLKEFSRHSLSNNILRYGGNNIFSHTYGPGVYNGFFTKDGSTFNSYATVRLDQTIYIDYSNNTGLLSEGMEASGTYVASTLEDMVPPADNKPFASSLQKIEFRNGTVISGVELVLTSGLSGITNPVINHQDPNHFVVYRLNSTNTRDNSDNYLIDNTLIKTKTISGFNRIRFDLSSYPNNNLPNKFIKDHKFRANIKATIANESVTRIGGGGLGVWLHTGIIDGKIWSWTRNGWVMSDFNTITSDQIIQDLSITWTLDSSGYKDFLVDPPSGIRTACVDEIIQLDVETSSFPAGILKLTEDFFFNFSFDFDTINQKISVPESYYGIKDGCNLIADQVHKTDQKYYVEVFMIPDKSNKNKFMLLDNVNIVDLTCNTRARIPISGGQHSEEPYRSSGYHLTCSGINEVVVEPMELLEIFRFFNYQGRGFLSRDATITSGIHDVSGGSRISYRESPEWSDNTKDATHQYYTLLDIAN